MKQTCRTLRPYIIIFIAILALCPAFTSCLDEEKFDTPTGARLRFAMDTLDMDTVIANTVSPTKMLSIYNDNSAGISITNVTIEGDTQYFMAIVDGRKINGELPDPIDCSGKDSLLALVQFSARPTDSPEPQACEAKLILTLANGLQQRIVLKGYSQDVITMRDKHITADTTFMPDRPIMIYEDLTIDEGATLTIAPGTTLLFHTTSGIQVDGTLIARGTATEPITFRGHRYDNMFVNQPYDRIDNQWRGITFTTTSYDNHLDHCDIHSSNRGIACDSSDVDRLKLKLENSIIHNTKWHALWLNQCKTFVGNCQITNAEANCIDISGGDNTFVHCTVGSFSPFIAFRGNALVFRYGDEEHPTPIKRLEFYNSIITGYANDEIFAYGSDHDESEDNYAFYNCLLNTPAIDDKATIMNNVWETKDMEVKGQSNFINFNLRSLIFDFGLTENSPARMIADPAITQKYYPLDRLGRPRDEHPDAGCYVWVPATEE